jgi:hypothetical protein
MIRGYLTKASVFVFITTALIFGPFPGEAKQENGKKKGVPHVLNEILTEIQNINGNLVGIDCSSTIKGAIQNEGLVTDPENGSEIELVNITGPGTFVAARLVKQGGGTGLTSVELIIDGETVVGRNIVALKNWAMTQSNPFGVVVFSNQGLGIDTVTIGFSQPISFEENLVLKAAVGEDGVEQIIGTVIHGE